MILAQTDVPEPWQTEVATIIVNGLLSLAVMGLIAWVAWLGYRLFSGK